MLVADKRSIKVHIYHAKNADWWYGYLHSAIGIFCKDARLIFIVLLIFFLSDWIFYNCWLTLSMPSLWKLDDFSINFFEAAFPMRSI